VSTNIQNIDLRWELYQEQGQMISISGFFKAFDKPIEMTQFATQTGSFQPRNVGDGEVVGAELEMRRNLGFISPPLEDFSLTGNLTFTHSRIELSKTEFDSRTDNARTGQVIDKYRDMAGQAPYIVNLGFAYNGGETGFWTGFEAGLYYNVQGETLQYVGIADRPDIYAKPFHSLNVNLNKTFGKEKRYQVGLKVENLLNAKAESIFKSFEAADQYFSQLSSGTTIQARFSYSLYK
jgi:outer membrane receptor protein involved in Fe transport